jgi:hypothetical protein
MGVSPKKSIPTSINDFFAQENEFKSPIGRERSEKMNFGCHYRRQMSRNARNARIDKSLCPPFARNGKRNF